MAELLGRLGKSLSLSLAMGEPASPPPSPRDVARSRAAATGRRTYFASCEACEVDQFLADFDPKMTRTAPRCVTCDGLLTVFVCGPARQAGGET